MNHPQSKRGSARFASKNAAPGAELEAHDEALFERAGAANNPLAGWRPPQLDPSPLPQLPDTETT